MERNHGATVASIHNTLMIRWKLHGKLPKWKKMGGKQGLALQASTNYISTASPLNMWTRLALIILRLNMSILTPAFPDYLTLECFHKIEPCFLPSLRCQIWLPWCSLEKDVLGKVSMAWQPITKTVTGKNNRSRSNLETKCKAKPQ